MLHWRCLCFVLAHLSLVWGFDLVRLTNPEADGSYTVEVRYDQKWRTLCGHNWYPANARVVCKQVGQPSGRCVADFRTIDKHAGEDFEGINLNYKCLGNETALHKCPSVMQDLLSLSRDCMTNVRPAVICGSSCPSWRYGPDCLPCRCNINNTMNCDTDSGKCTCKAGYSGDLCDCVAGNHTCNLTTSYCHVDSGNPVCLCKKGIISSAQNPCVDFGLRFINNRSVAESGEVEFYRNGTWNPLCFGRTSSQNILGTQDVICRQLSLPTTHAKLYLKNFISRSQLPEYEISEAVCSGSESSLTECRMSLVPALKCNMALGIHCFSVCPEWQFGKSCKPCSCNKTNSVSCDHITGQCTCRSGFSGATCDCLKGNNPCNETISECHLPTITSTPVCMCKTEYMRKNYSCIDPIRLSNKTVTTTSSGTKLYEGRVEVFINGTWGTICDDTIFSGNKLARVLCNSLGYPSNYSKEVGSAYYGEGSGPIHYTYQYCIGTETSISQCLSSTSLSCGHHEDMGIKCGAECPDFSFGEECIQCQCVRANTRFCNKTTGECICKNSYEGQTCSCLKGNHTCNLQTSICESGKCFCKHDNKAANSSCFERLRLVQNNGTKVQYYTNGSWNYLCYDNSWGASYLCQRLHLPTYIAKLDFSHTTQQGYEFKIDENCRYSNVSNADCLVVAETPTYCNMGLANLQCLHECPDWTHFSGSECIECSCNMQNTKSCDKKTGKCLCKTGYEGDLCNCPLNTCNSAVSFCQKTNNGITCLCKPGYENRGFPCKDSLRLIPWLAFGGYKRLELNVDGVWMNVSRKEYDESADFGICQRMGLPTFITNSSVIQIPSDLDNIGSVCMTKAFSYLTLNYTECQLKNIEDSQMPFYYSPRYGLQMVTCLEDCPDMMMYNKSISSCVPCRCNPNNTLSCNQTTGACICKTGFDGPSCDCVTAQHSCNHTVSYCSFHGATPVCVCRPGFYGKQLGCFENLRFLRDTGVLEMYHNNQWMLVSTGYSWADIYTKIICRQLGLPTFYVAHESKTRYSTGMLYSDFSSKSRITSVDCTGNEAELSQCDFSTSSYISSYAKFPIIECRSDCPKFRFGPTCELSDCNQQRSSDCNKTTGQCYCLQGYSGETCDCEDGVHYCNSTFAFCGEPTATCYCREQYNRQNLTCQDSLKFYHNETGTEGLLLLYRNRTWNTFCDDFFSSVDAIVACRQLHLPSRYVTLRAVSDSQRVDSSVAIIYNTDCNGTETSLSECRLSSYGGYCSHSEDIYIQCFPNCPNFTFGPNCENPCTCNKTTSMSCDEDTGQCYCKAGFFGELCSCKNGVHTCNETISFCDTSYNGTAICLCKPGYSESEYQKEGCLKEHFRLKKTEYPDDALVALYQSGVWMGICIDGISADTARVVCRHFGLPEDYAQLSRNTESDNTYSKKFEIVCNGTEKSLDDCSRQTTNNYCYGESAVFVCPKDRLIRLVSIQKTTSGSSGLVEINYRGTWNNLCPYNFGIDEAKVACRELGLPTKHVLETTTSQSLSDEVYPSYLSCTGNEENLRDCRQRGSCSIYYFRSSVVKLTCNSACPSMKFGENCNRDCPCDTESTSSCDMNTGECVCKPGFSGHTCNCASGSHSCNTTVSDCYYESNQIHCICKAGYTNYEHGCEDNVRIDTTDLVEIFEQKWRKVCSRTSWNPGNSLVVCRQLNLSTEVIYTESVYDSVLHSSTSITCNGTEKTWQECQAQLSSSSYCSYSRKLLCGKCPDWKYSNDCSKTCQCDKKTSKGCDPITGDCLCHDKYGGADCSCHTSMISTCKSPYSTCEYDRCKCNQGLFNVSTSCSDMDDVTYFCSFNGYNWKDSCDMETTSRLQRHSESRYFYSSWRPQPGSDDTEYAYVDERPYYFSSSEFFASLNFSLGSKQSQLCVFFDYITTGRGSIVLSMKDTSMIESTIVTLSTTKTGWTNKRTNINSSLPIEQIIFRLEEKTAIDQIIITDSMCDCANWTFGSSCDDCTCVRLHTEFCDKNNGTCHCKQGYIGEACQCEDNGEPCPHYIRLVNGNTTSMGRIEVVTNGVWSTICDSNWDHDDATVVCKQLRLGKYGIAVSDAEFGRGVGPNYISKVNCVGDETDLLTCPFEKLSCSHENDAGVICVNKSSNIRLVDGSDETEGRLEVKLNGRGSWGTVCDDGFDESDAKVACKELGLPTREIAVKARAYFGRGSGPILMSNLRCSGTEMSIHICSKTEHPGGCSHSEDVGIVCSNECSSFKFGDQCERSCVCDQSKSLSCDKDTGDCICRTGWTGVRCTCGRGTECGENSYCDGDDCLCIDGFFTTASNCSDEEFVLFSCSFETDIDTCSINNYGAMKWKRDSRGTPSDDTGPYTAKEGIHYVYTEATSQSEGDEGVMEISLTSLNLTTHTCFQFYFHMRGRDMGDLNVIIEEKPGSEIVRWSKTGHINSNWNRGYISLPPDSQKIKIIGTRGDGYRSDIAMDDFKIFQEHCSCEPWKYGLLCEKSCDCKRVSSESCDSKSGSCVCQPGWSGKTCNCRMLLDNCHSAYSYCHGDRCLCKDGIYSNGVTCSGLNDITYHCGFDMEDSLEQCNIELGPMYWEIKEDSDESLDDGYHLDNNRFLMTKVSIFSPESFFLFSINNISVDRESCLQAKYFINYEKEQMLRIQVVKDNNLLNNILFQGKGWSTARVPLNASSNMKIYFIGYSSRSSPIMIDDIIITAKSCVGCSPWYYGANCEKMAECNRDNTVSFGDRGECHCKTNWFGDRCSCSKIENDTCFRDGEICRNGQCTCKDGYTRAGTGCRDIDECKFLCKSQAQECTNTDGSYTCVCKNGALGDGNICSDSDLALINGTSPQEGTLVIWKQGAWGALCMDFDLFTGITACNTMFKDIFGVYITKRGNYRSTNGVAYTSPKCNRRGTFDFENCDVTFEPCDTEKDALYLNCGVCGGKYTSEFGLVEPPPQLPGNTLCSFLLSPTDAKTINATFITFSFGSTGESRSKRFYKSCQDTDTYIEIFDGSNTDAPFLGRFCNNRGRFTITSAGSSLYFLYRTSRNTSEHDFQIIYETEKALRDPRILGEQCVTDIQCIANNASCVDSMCNCEIDFYKWDEATCAKKKAWNSACYESKECKTEFCDAVDKLCLCPPNTIIDENYNYCLDNTDKTEFRTSSPKYWMIPFLLFVFLIIALLIAATVILARRKGYCLMRRDQNAAYTYSELMSTSNPLYGMSTDDKSSHRGSVISINVSGCDGRHRIRLSNFLNTYQEMCDDMNWPEDDFQKILQSCPAKPTDIGSSSKNRYKNRNKAILPYDFNRLRESGSTSVDDYINASVIEGLHSHYPYYIVTQYPLITTQNDFWRMVWKQRVSSIINLVSNTEKEVYFPTKTGLCKTYGKIKVQVLSSLTVNRCTFRCMKITKGSMSHTVNHFQASFLSEFTTNECQDLINLITLVHSNAEGGNDSRPFVIHCLNGSGKSGVFVAMDYLIQLIKNGDTHVDIFSLVHTLISNREKLIENETQYKFLFECVGYYLEQGKTNPSHKLTEEITSEDEDTGLIEISPTETKTHFANKF
ncbi:uncharacterized protein LOC128180917 isoform X1 [Crassostrea angulata]|uniref:uncharacterized protein LOC128180917 isoform X1 n=1 Tax=Magallana angulata TaxID=2784310 RepID=UPI0022B10CAC|nr:uncharacterized protein LOC128180917 isoform X1 [Crassostrea angulata]